MAYETINVRKNGISQATPVIIVGSDGVALGGDTITSVSTTTSAGNVVLNIMTDLNPTGYETTIPSSEPTIIIQQNTNNTTITTTETVVNGISIPVEKDGMYTATVRINVLKPTGGGTSIVTVKGLINGAIADNTLRQRSVINDGSINYLEYTFTGNLTTGQVLTLSLQRSGTVSGLLALHNEPGVVGCQVELLKI